MTANRRAWTDLSSAPHVQPALFDPVAVADAQPKRRRPGSAKRPALLEREIQSVILAALKLHPKVARIERINVMAGRLMGKDGSASRFMRSCAKGRVDLDGFSVDGKVIAIEVKRPHTRKNVSAEQMDYLGSVRAAGGLAGVATSVEEAFAIVEGRK